MSDHTLSQSKWVIFSRFRDDKDEKKKTTKKPQKQQTKQNKKKNKQTWMKKKV
jgi:hypothetical protein